MARHLGSSLLLQRHAGLSAVETRLGVSYEVRVRFAVELRSMDSPVIRVKVDEEGAGDVP
jgi:hypothetical protein